MTRRCIIEVDYQTSSSEDSCNRRPFMEAFEVLFKAVGALLVCGLMGNVLSDLQDGPTKAELRKIDEQDD